MKVLGYNGGIGGYIEKFGMGHNAAAALVIDGELVAAVEEERFDRNKMSSAFPIESMKYCLREAGLKGLDDLDLICFFHSNERMFERAIVDENAHRFGHLGRAILKGSMSAMRSIKKLTRVDDRSSELTFARNTGWVPPLGKYRVLWHHLSHAASSFYESPFERALCVALDAQGESHSSTAFIGDRVGLHLIDSTYTPNSVGYLYQAITHFLGFETGDEYKVMGLAPYGDASRYRRFFEKILRAGKDGRFELDMNLIGWLVLRDAFAPKAMGYPPSVIRELGLPRRESDSIEQRHMDIAASLQEALERSVLHWLERLRAKTGIRNLCLAGGVALNCTLNGKIARSGIFEGVHVAPASHDAGTASGAALYGYHAILGGARKKAARAKVYLGPSYSTSELQQAVSEMQHSVRANRPDDPTRSIAQAIADGKVVAYFQGRMEWGPRALGNRSILADPRRADMKDIVNHAVKLREGFRPFAPAVLAEKASEWFQMTGLGGESPYMLFTVPVHDGKREKIPSVTHVDGSARVQTVKREDNPRFHAIIDSFYELTGVPIVMNTSFNVKGEPIVNTPLDAIRCFLGTQIDMLVLDDLILEKVSKESSASEYAPAAAESDTLPLTA